MRDELFGDRVHLGALAALADSDWVLGDLGCGTGQVSAALAPFVAPRDRGGRIGGDAAGGAQAAAARSTTSICGAASSKRCRSTTRGSTPRR